MDETQEVTGPERATTLDDLFDFDGALAYVNARLPEGRQLSMVGFRRHVYDDPKRPGSLFQLEPITVGRREFDEGERAVTRVFTRRMLDEYLAHREHNARRGVARAIVRPTAAELATILSWSEARARINERLARRGIRHRMTATAFNRYRAGGKLPHRVIGRAAVYLAGDVDRFTAAWVRSWRGRSRPRKGRPLGANPR